MNQHARTQSGASRRSRAVAAPSWRPWPSDERGSVSVVVALSMTALLALMALGIDLGALFDARSEAQRAADAAALAGASAFLDYDRNRARQPAIERAVEFATSNEIRSEPIAVDEVLVSVNLDSSTVSAQVRRSGVPTWFARLVGIDSVDIGAQATAWAGAGAAAQCVKPFAVPDMWEETNDDLNGNQIWDEGERWRFDPEAGDRYEGYSGGSDPGETGYGSGWRDDGLDADGQRFDRDYGRRITVKVTDPRNTIMSSFFFPWVLPSDAGQGDCGTGGPGGGGGNGNGGGNGGGDGGGGGGQDAGGEAGDGDGGGLGWLKWWDKREELGVGAGGGGERGASGGIPGGEGSGTGGVRRVDGPTGAAAYRRNICTCNRNLIDLDSEYLIEPGNMVGPTHQGVSALIAQDPDAYWDDRSNTVVSQYGMDSPRVVTVGLFNPAEIRKPGRQYIRFNNFARVFIEEQASPQDPVTGRFLYYVRGAGLSGREGETKGSLIRVLQLIK